MDPMPEATEATSPRRPGAVRRWILDHDEKWLFILAYVGLAVALSIWISLFWLVAVVAGHGVLEWIRQSHLARAAGGSATDPAAVASRVAWELKLDVALILFALALTAYMDVILGLAGLGGAARLAQTGARTAGWVRALRGGLLSLDDAVHVARGLALRRRGGGDGGGEEDAGSGKNLRRVAGVAAAASPWRPPWPPGARLALGFGAVCAGSLLLAPWLTAHDWGSLAEALFAEMHPWPFEPVAGNP